MYFGPALKAHWGLEDPSEISGSEAQINGAFNATLAIIETRCRAFFQLPFAQLDAAALQTELERIARL
ncbi:hypothetical protein D3C81_2034200 [compost metagenome]